MPGSAFLRGDEASLHPVEEEDLDFLRRYRNDPDVRMGLTVAHPQNAYEAEQTYERHTKDDSSISFLIVPADADDPVGEIVLFDIDETHGTGELSAWITPEVQGNGYATAGTQLILRYAFAERRLRKVIARSLVDNAASRATLNQLGMTEEGIQRHEKYVGGDYHDVVRYSMLRREWGER